MTTVAEIQAAVRTLAEEQFRAFSAWFEQYEEERWDRQIGRDQKAGPLRGMMDKALADFAAGKCTHL